MDGGSERRLAPRVPLRGRVIASTQGRRLSCPAVDLSPGGLAVVGSGHDLRGQHIHVDFDLEHDSGRISAEGLVVGNSTRQGRNVWGVRFVDVHPKLQNVLSRYVSWRLGLGPRPMFETVALGGPMPEAPASKRRARKPTWVPPGRAKDRYQPH